MAESHRHLAITEDEWAAFMNDLHLTLTRFQVPHAAELVAIVESPFGKANLKKSYLRYDLKRGQE
jgi:hypothetical protein